MRLFHRCKHNWQIVAVQKHSLVEAWAWETKWNDLGPHTTIRYVCSNCQKDTSRTVMGSFTIAQAKVVFPKP